MDLTGFIQVRDAQLAYNEKLGVKSKNVYQLATKGRFGEMKKTGSRSLWISELEFNRYMESVIEMRRWNKR